MNRSEFLRTSSQFACGSCLALLAGTRAAAELPTAASPPTPVDEALKKAQAENTFTNNWLDDLFEAVHSELSPADQLKLMQATGRGCFRRHKFKTDIAEAGKGDVDKLLAAYRRNFNIERDGDLVHIRYGGGKCFCPVARNRPGRPDDVHCECTRFTHESVFSTALGRPIRGEIVESVRRGGANCHIVVHLT